MKFLSKQFMEYVKKSASSSGQVQGNKGIFALFKSFLLIPHNCDTYNKNFTKVVKKPLPFNPWKNCAPEGWS